MENKPLNVVYIGPLSFPLGMASTKRRKYMIDYMNSRFIQSHVLVTGYYRNSQNPIEGIYINTDYYDLSYLFAGKRLLEYYRKGKNLLKGWYNPQKKNVLIFHTLVYYDEWFFYKYAQKLGYRIVFDQVETSYLQNKTGSILFRLKTYISECLSYKAYQKYPAFVISTALMQENKTKYPNRKLCLLPNSTPVINAVPKSGYNKSLTLLYSGTYTPKDGVSYLIDGVIEAHNRKIDCHLILLGKGNKQDMRVLEKIKGKNYIEYKGFVSDEELNNTMRNSDILCMTRTNSRFANYGFPFKLSEYLATGNILLASDIGDVSKYVKHKESALLVEPENAKAISDAIAFVDENKDLALSIARNGFLVMQKHFSIDSVGRIFESFLNKI